MVKVVTALPQGGMRLMFWWILSKLYSALWCPGSYLNQLRNEIRINFLTICWHSWNQNTSSLGVMKYSHSVRGRSRHCVTHFGISMAIKMYSLVHHQPSPVHLHLLKVTIVPKKRNTENVSTGIYHMINWIPWPLSWLYFFNPMHGRKSTGPILKRM